MAPSISTWVPFLNWLVEIRWLYPCESRWRQGGRRLHLPAVRREAIEGYATDLGGKIIASTMTKTRAAGTWSVPASRTSSAAFATARQTGSS
jgi:hypothetical protein